MDHESFDHIDELAAMRMGIEYKDVIQVRGYQLTVRPLSLSETNQVAAEVSTRLQSLPDQQRNALAEHTILAKETLKVASTSDVGATDLKITDYVLDRMTTDEILHLWRQYCALTDKVNPGLEFMEISHVKELVADLKKNPHELDSRLTELSFMQVASIARYFLTSDE